MSDSLREFAARRRRQNERLLQDAPLPIKRFFALDADVYQEGALPKKTKELLGLAASTVLRCNDCIAYHIGEATTAGGATRDELFEAIGIALVVGGSITIPHLRFATEYIGRSTTDD